MLISATSSLIIIVKDVWNTRSYYTLSTKSVFVHPFTLKGNVSTNSVFSKAGTQISKQTGYYTHA